MAEQDTALKMIDTKKKINKVVNRKFSKTQVVEKSFILDEGGMESYYKAIGRIAWAITGMVFIMPVCAIWGAIEGISIGLKDGIKVVAIGYRKYLD